MCQKTDAGVPSYTAASVFWVDGLQLDGTVSMKQQKAVGCSIADSHPSSNAFVADRHA